MLQNLVSSVQNKNTGGTSAATTAICNCLECLQCQVDDISSTVDGMSTQVNTCCVVANTGNISTVNASTVDTTSLTADTASISGTVTAACVSSTNASVDCINSDNITATCANVTNLTATNATINGSISPTSVTTSCVTATNACVATGNITNLTSTCVNACSLSGTSATVDIVNAACGNISHLVTDLIESATTCSTNANVTTLVATTGNINTVNANSVTASSIVSCYITADAIKADGTITTSGLTTEEGWYTLYIPPFNNFNLQLSGTWNNEEWGINIIGTSETSIVQATQRDLTTIKEVDFVAEGGTYIELRNDSTIKYILHYTDSNYTDSDITVELNTTPTVDYSYAPSKTKFYIFRGYENNSAEVVIPCLSKIFSIAAEEQAYERTTTDDIYINEHVYLTSDWDSGGQPTSCSPGEDNQYISVCNTGCTDVYGCDVCLATWKTPVDTTTGTLSDSTCLITERAVSTYNGTTNAGYPIVHLGDGTCAHGLATADCVCGTCCVETPVLNATNVYATSANVTCDVVIGGDLYVNGTSHIVDEETLEVQGDVLTIRANNPSALASGQVAGINVNKYDGTNSLSVVTDCTGTLRVGTGAGTDTAYTNIAFNADDNLWYDYDGTTYTEMATQPSGTMTSWEGKVEDAPYTRYDSVTFTVVDVTSLEPVLTRDEEADMEDGFVTKWDASNTKAVTTGAVCTHDVCTCGDINVTGSVTAASDITSSTSVTAPVVCGTTCVDTPYANAACICSTDCAHINDMCTEGNVTISGDLYVCGDTTIEGIMSSTKLLTAATSCDARYYPTFVENNNTTAGSEYYFTNGCVSVNPSTGTMYATRFCANNECSVCTVKSCLLASDIGLTGNTYYALADIIAAIQDCCGYCATSYAFPYSASDSPIICESANYAYNYRFNKLDNNIVGTDCWQQTQWQLVNNSGKELNVRVVTNANTTPLYYICAAQVGNFSSECPSAMPVVLGTTSRNTYTYYSACCPLCFTPTTGLLSSTCLCATSCVSTPVVCGTTYVYGCKVYAGMPGACTSSVAGVAGGRYDQGYMELYTTSPYIDFHKNMYCGDYSQRIQSNCDSLGFLVTNGNGCTASTACSSFAMCANGIFKGNGLCGSCWVCTPALTATTINAATVCASTGIESSYFKTNCTTVCYTPASSGASAYLLIGCVQNTQCASENNVSLSFDGPGVVNSVDIQIITSNAASPYVEVKTSEPYGPYVGLQEIIVTTNGTTWNCYNLIYAKVTGYNTCTMPIHLFRQEVKNNWSTAMTLSTTAPTGTCVFCQCVNKRGTWSNSCTTYLGNACIISSSCNDLNVGISNTVCCSESVAFGYCNEASCSLSVALGRYSQATAAYATAVGNASCATGTCSVSVGRTNTASSQLSSAVGVNNTASCACSSAIGFCNTASGTWGAAVGYCNTSSGDDSDAVGSKNTASGCLSSAVGRQNTASGCQSVAVGYSNTALLSATAIGRGNNASGEGSIAVGTGNTPSGVNSNAFGRSNTSSGCMSSTFGTDNIASTLQSVAIGVCNCACTCCGTTAIGRFNVSTGTDASTFGKSNTASGDGSAAFGRNNTASCFASSVVGVLNTASGNCSTAFGFCNTASGCLSSAVGAANTASGAMTAAVGYGNTVSGCLSTVVGVSNANVGATSTVVGYCNCTSGCANTVALGNNNFVIGTCNVTVGACNTVCTTRAVSLGSYANVYGTYGVSVGFSATTCGSCSVAVGREVLAQCASSVILGNNAYTCNVVGGLAIGDCARSGTCCGIMWSTINTSSDSTYGRHGMINLTIPSCAYHCDINIALRHIFTDVINIGRCTNCWGPGATGNVPTLRAAFYGYHWDDDGSTDGCQRWTSGINSSGCNFERIYVDVGNAACSTLSTCQLLYTCGCKVRTTSWNWSGYSSTSVWTCGAQGIIVY